MPSTVIRRCDGAGCLLNAACFQPPTNFDLDGVLLNDRRCPHNAPLLKQSYAPAEWKLSKLRGSPYSFARSNFTPSPSPVTMDDSPKPKYPSSEDEWTKVRPEITRLYDTQDWPLPKVMEYMEKTHLFKAT